MMTLGEAAAEFALPYRGSRLPYICCSFALINAPPPRVICERERPWDSPSAGACMSAEPGAGLAPSTTNAHANITHARAATLPRSVDTMLQRLRFVAASVMLNLGGSVRDGGWDRLGRCRPLPTHLPRDRSSLMCCARGGAWSCSSIWLTFRLGAVSLLGGARLRMQCGDGGRWSTTWSK
jgi:hypothetical protein